jgi:hypothetical protein
VINATTGRAIAKLAETLGLTVKMRGESTEVLLVTDLGHGRVNCALAAQTLAGEWIAARYSKDRGEWQSRQGSAGAYFRQRNRCRVPPLGSSATIETAAILDSTRRQQRRCRLTGIPARCPGPEGSRQGWPLIGHPSDFACPPSGRGRRRTRACPSPEVFEMPGS